MSTTTMQQIVTQPELHGAIDVLREALQNNIVNGDTCVRADLRRRASEIETNLRGRMDSQTNMLQEVVGALNDVAKSRQRDLQKLDLLQRRVAELEAKTWRARWARVVAKWRAFVAELGGSWFYEDEPQLDPRVIDELITMYNPPSLPLVPKDARHGR